MHAVDTNVIVRLLTGDDPQQYARAQTLIAREQVYVPMTVLLETEWVLRTAYRFSAPVVAKALRDFAGLPTITLEAPVRFKAALDWFQSGMDFADALHLAASSHCEAMISFDTDLAKIAKRLGAGDVRRP